MHALKSSSRKSLVIGLLAVCMIGFVVYAGSQYALFSHEMKISAHEHIGTVFIHGKIHGQPFQWVNNVEVSTALPGVSMMLGDPYSYMLQFQGMQGNKARLKFTVWQSLSPTANQHGKDNKGGIMQNVRPMVWKSVMPSMIEKLATKSSPEPIYSPMSEMHYLTKNGKVSRDAGTQNELQAAWLGASDALDDVDVH